MLIAAAGLGALGAAIASSAAYLAASVCYFAVYFRFRSPARDALAQELASAPLT